MEGNPMLPFVVAEIESAAYERGLRTTTPVSL